MKTSRTLLFSILLAIFALTSTPAWAGDLKNVTEIVNKANVVAYYQGNDGRARVKMTIVDAKGNKRVRKLRIVRKDVKDGGDQYFFVYFKRPADVARTTFMVHKHVGRDDDRWMYLPALDLVKRISSADKRTSFVGSHFFYEDISGRPTNADKHKLVKTTDKFYVIRSTPKKPGSVEFKSYTVWIDKATFVPKKAIFINKAGKKYRKMEATKVKTIGGKVTVTSMKVSDLINGGYTINRMTKIKYDIGVPKSIFAERSLRNPPKKYLK
jgi:hypothetical protein